MTREHYRAAPPVASEEKPVRQKPYQRWRHPPGCPDSDWCAGNGVCYWRCDDDGEDCF